MIARRAKFVDTAPEKRFMAYAESRRMGLRQNVSLPFVDDNGGHYVFQLDFARPLVKAEDGFDVDFEIDGPGHDSPLVRGKDAWKDWTKNKHGLKVIHIPAVLTEKKWWGYLDSQIAKALLSPIGAVYIPA